MSIRKAAKNIGVSESTLRNLVAGKVKTISHENYLKLLAAARSMDQTGEMVFTLRLSIFGQRVAEILRKYEAWCDREVGDSRWQKVAGDLAELRHTAERVCGRSVRAFEKWLDGMEIYEGRRRLAWLRILSGFVDYDIAPSEIPAEAFTKIVRNGIASERMLLKRRGTDLQRAIQVAAKEGDGPEMTP